MAVVTTGSTLYSLNAGLSEELNYGAGSAYASSPRILYVNGNPDGIVTNNTGSQIAFDALNQAFYFSRAINGSTWFNLGSTA